MSTNETRNELIAAISSNLEEANEILRVTGQFQEVYVVMVGETLIRFQDMSNPKSPADPCTTSISKATVLTGFTVQSLAELAHAVTNGAGTHGHVVRLYDAAKLVADRSSELLQRIEEAAQ